MCFKKKKYFDFHFYGSILGPVGEHNVWSWGKVVTLREKTNEKIAEINVVHLGEKNIATL